MKKGILFFLVLLALVSCANQSYDNSTKLGQNHAGLQGDLGSTNGPMIDLDDVTATLGPMDFSEETILIKFSESADPPQWSSQDFMKNYLGVNVTSKVGFGQLSGDIGQEENRYAISLPWDLQKSQSKPMWLHVATGTEVNGKFEEGSLFDSGNKYEVTNLTFSFSRYNRRNGKYDIEQQNISVKFEDDTASAQLVDRNDYPILEGGNEQTLQLQLRVEAEVKDKNGGMRKLTFERLCGAKFEDLPVPKFDELYR